MAKNDFADLKSRLTKAYIRLFPIALKGIANVFGSVRFFSSDRSFAHVRLPNLCLALPRQPQNQKLHLPRPVSLYGFCSNDIPRKPTRHRSVPQSSAEQALSYGYSGSCFAQYPGKRQQSPRLADLCRLCPNTDSDCPSVIHQRLLRHRTGKHGLCFGFHHHRSLFECIPVGSFSKNQSDRQTAYPAGSAWKHPYLYPDHRRQGSRCQNTGYPGHRAGKFLHHGSGLSGFFAALYDASKRCLFRYSHKIQFEISSYLFPPGRQTGRSQMRSDHPVDGVLCCQKVSGKTATNQILRFKEQTNFRVFNQQLSAVTDHYCRSISLSVAGGAIF